MYKCKFNFKKAKFLSVEYFDGSQHILIDLLPFMEEGPLYKRKPESCICNVKKAKLLSVEYFDSSHRRMVDLLPFMEEDPLINGNPKVV